MLVRSSQFIYYVKSYDGDRSLLSVLQTNLSHTSHLSVVGDHNDEQDIFSPQLPKSWSIIANFTPQIIKCQTHLLGLIQVSPVTASCLKGTVHPQIQLLRLFTHLSLTLCE